MVENEHDLGWICTKAKKDEHDCKLPVLSADERHFLNLLHQRFSDYSKDNDCSSFENAKKAVEHLIDLEIRSQMLEIDDDQRRYLFDASLSHMAGFAPLDILLTDREIEEIAMIGPNSPIYIYKRNRGWQKTNARITTIEHLIHLANKMSRSLGRRITTQNPRLNAVLPNGSRLHASIPPISKGEMTIRLHSSTPWSIADVLHSGSTTKEALAFLWLAFQSDSSVLIAGNTASGKTTLLNTLLTMIPKVERMVVIEETPELHLLHSHVVKLISNDDLKIDMSSLVKDSLRMRPDRVVVGEIRTENEVESYTETLLSGQARGSYATFHAQSTNEATQRLVNLGARKDDLSSLNYVVVQRRISNYDEKSKKQTEIRKMISIDSIKVKNSQIQSIPLFSYNPKTNMLEPSARLEDEFTDIGSRLGLSPEQTRRQFEMRVGFLETLEIQTPQKIFEKLQRFTYG